MLIKELKWTYRKHTEKQIEKNITWPNKFTIEVDNTEKKKTNTEFRIVFLEKTKQQQKQFF